MKLIEIVIWNIKKFRNYIEEHLQTSQRKQQVNSSKADYDSEISFWEDAIAGKKIEWVEKALNPATSKDVFPQRLRSYVEKSDKKLKLLDVGSGPVSPLVWGIEMNLLEVVAIDPLADSYNNLLKKLNYSYPIVPIKCYGEDILDHFEIESFDIVYCANALDHAMSPKRCIDNIYNVLKKDGIIYLTGYIKEGTNAKWSGLHQHDLVPENGQLVHYDQKGKMTNLTKDLAGLKCIYEDKKGVQTGDIYVMMFKKS